MQEGNHASSEKQHVEHPEMTVYFFCETNKPKGGYNFFPFYWRKRPEIRNILVCLKFLRIFEVINQVYSSDRDDSLLFLIANGYGSIFSPKERVVEFQTASGSKSVLLLLA